MSMPSLTKYGDFPPCMGSTVVLLMCVLPGLILELDKVSSSQELLLRLTVQSSSHSCSFACPQQFPPLLSIAVFLASVVHL